MNELLDTEARHQINERVKRALRAAPPPGPAAPPAFAERLRRLADRIDN